VDKDEYRFEDPDESLRSPAATAPPAWLVELEDGCLAALRIGDPELIEALKDLIHLGEPPFRIEAFLRQRFAHHPEVDLLTPAAMAAARSLDRLRKSGGA